MNPKNIFEWITVFVTEEKTIKMIHGWDPLKKQKQRECIKSDNHVSVKLRKFGLIDQYYFFQA